MVGGHQIVPMPKRTTFVVMFISVGLVSYHLHTKLGTLTDHYEISRPNKHMSRDSFGI